MGSSLESGDVIETSGESEADFEELINERTSVQPLRDYFKAIPKKEALSLMAAYGFFPELDLPVSKERDTSEIDLRFKEDLRALYNPSLKPNLDIN